MISKTLTNDQTLLERSKNNELTALQKEISIKNSNKEKKKQDHFIHQSAIG